MLTQAVIDLYVRRGVNITQAQTTTDKTSPVAEMKGRGSICRKEDRPVTQYWGIPATCT